MLGEAWKPSSDEPQVPPFLPAVACAKGQGLKKQHIHRSTLASKMIDPPDCRNSRYIWGAAVATYGGCVGPDDPPPPVRRLWSYDCGHA